MLKRLAPVVVLIALLAGGWSSAAAQAESRAVVIEIVNEAPFALHRLGLARLRHSRCPPAYRHEARFPFEIAPGEVVRVVCREVPHDSHSPQGRITYGYAAGRENSPYASRVQLFWRNPASADQRRYEAVASPGRLQAEVVTTGEGPRQTARYVVRDTQQGRAGD